MTELHNLQPFVSRIQAEHRKLIGMLHALNQCNFIDVQTEQDCQQLSRQLHDLDRFLRQHIEDEEQGGCLEQAIAQAPHLAHRLRSIEHEHTDLLVELKRIIMVTEFQPADVFKLEFDNIRKFSQQMLKHEAAETQLLQAGFNEDLELEVPAE